jgi:hypothetical protein
MHIMYFYQIHTPPHYSERNFNILNSMIQKETLEQRPEVNNSVMQRNEDAQERPWGDDTLGLYKDRLLV